jgi:hypothetical protein
VPGICTGVSRCHEVARVDVDGDGAPDTVALARRGPVLDAPTAVLVRVRTASGQTVQTLRQVEPWSGRLWQGAGLLDGRPGSELVIGEVNGAHARFFQVLTWRAGHLVQLDAPGTGTLWGIDGADWINAGWRRPAGAPQGVIEKRLAIREGADRRGPFRGGVATFRWTRGGWRRVGLQILSPMTDREATSWGGWEVSGLNRW